MKKTLLLSGALFAAALTAAITTNTVSANTDYTSQQGDSTANFTINNDGESGQNTLYLSAEPSFTFKDANLKAIMSGATTLQSADNPSDTLTVNDYTGDSLGWTVKANLSDFTSKSGDKITASKLTYTQDGVNALNFVSTDNKLTSPVTLTGADSNVLVAAKGDGQGTTSTKASAATLDLPQDKTAKAENYSANITWTLTQGQPAETDQGAGE